MKKSTISVTIVLCLVLCLAACGQTGDDGASATPAPMTAEEYYSKVEEMSADIGEVMTSMSGLSASDEASFREGIETVREMAAPFREFAAIANPPEAYAEAHAQAAEGCTLFAESLESMCDSAIQYLDGKITADEYSTAAMDLTNKLNEAATLMSTGFSQMQ